MLVYNKWLKSIGVKEDQYPLIKGIPRDPPQYYHESQMYEGETWDLNSVMNMMIYSYLCEFEFHCKDKEGHWGAYPGEFENGEEWDKIFRRIKEGFRRRIVDNDDYAQYKEDYWRKTLKLFIKYYDNLWW